MTRNGKIARLPKAVRAELNRRLADGEPGKRLVAWLNTLPEVQATLAAEFAGRPITENNLSEWKTGGFREWELHQNLLATARNLTEHADELRATAGALTDQLALVLTARLAAALTEGVGPGEGVKARELRRLRALCADVVELRRGDHSAARLRLEQERREEEREKSEAEILGQFEQWATVPAVRQVLTDPRLPAAEKRRRLRKLFGHGDEPGAASPTPDPEPGEEEARPAAAPGAGGDEESGVKGEGTHAGEIAGAGAWGDAGRLGRPGQGTEAIRPNPTQSGPSFGSAPPLGLGAAGERRPGTLGHATSADSYRNID